MIGADLAPGVVERRDRSSTQLPLMQNLPEGVERALLGPAARGRPSCCPNSSAPLVSGIFLVFAVLVLLYKRLMPPFVNMGSLLLAPLGGAIALHIAGHAVSMPVMIGILMLLGIVAKNSILLIDFAHRGDGQGRAQERGDHRRRPQARPADRDDHGGDGRGHGPDRARRLSGDASWRAPMGVVVIGGLILSTVLTLVLVPASFSLADSFEKWLAPQVPPARHLSAASRITARRPAPQPAE